MITQEQIKELHGRLGTLKECLDIESKRKKVGELQKQTEAPDFWSDPKAAETFMKISAGGQVQRGKHVAGLRQGIYIDRRPGCAV